MSDVKNTKERGIGARIAGWATGKVRGPEHRAVGRGSLTGGLVAARDMLRPAPLDSGDFMAGLRGRHADGGVARFRAHMREGGTDARELPGIESTHRSISRSYAAMTLVCVLAAVLYVSRFPGIFSGLGAMVLMLFGFAFLAVSVRHDFAAWQIRVRRFAGFREYLDLRFGGAK